VLDQKIKALNELESDPLKIVLLELLENIKLHLE
jgi:hypothetical protein